MVPHMNRHWQLPLHMSCSSDTNRRTVSYKWLAIEFMTAGRELHNKVFSSAFYSISKLNGIYTEDSSTERIWVVKSKNENYMEFSSHISVVS
jgi:hypothetical protein